MSQRYLAFLAAAYAGLIPLEDPAVSPLLLSLARFPPTLVAFGQCEALAPQCHALGEKLRAAGVRVELDEAEDLVHAFHLLAGSLPTLTPDPKTVRPEPLEGGAARRA